MLSSRAVVAYWNEIKKFDFYGSYTETKTYLLCDVQKYDPS